MVAIGLKFDESPLAGHALIRLHNAPLPRLRPSRAHPGARAAALRGWEHRLRSEYQGMAFTRWFHGLTVELNAPMDLQEVALRMVLHEHQHARYCMAAAASLGGGTEMAFEPARLSGGDASRGPLTAFWESLLGPFAVSETVALRLLAASIRLLPPSPYRAILQTIARDEALHARIGFMVLAQARKSGTGSLRWIEAPPETWIRRHVRDFIAKGMARDVIEADEAERFRDPVQARALMRLGIPPPHAFKAAYERALRIDVPMRFRAIGIPL